MADAKVSEVRCSAACQVGARVWTVINAEKDKAVMTEGAHGVWVKLGEQRRFCVPYTNITYYAVE